LGAKSVILPGVGPSAGLAPGRDSSPPSFRNCAAIEAAIVELQTLCRHIKSAFFTSSEMILVYYYHCYIWQQQ